MANIKNVTLTKSDMHNPVAKLVRGDKRTSGLIMNIDRYDGTHDLSAGMRWSINIVNSKGDTDIVSFQPQVSDILLTYEWEFPPVISASEGVSMFNVMALNADGERVWQSGKRYVSVSCSVDATGGYEEEELTIFQQAVISTTHRIDKMQSDMDVYEVRIDNATNEAEQAVRDANAAINVANVATEKSNVATGRANTAASNADEATLRANTATSNANTATSNANAAALNANTAASNAISARNDTVSATNRANAASDKLDETIANANEATNNVNSAISNAATSASNANEAANRARMEASNASSAAENANSVANDVSRKLNNGEFNYILTNEDKKQIAKIASDTLSDNVDDLVVIDREATEYTKLKIDQSANEIEILTVEDLERLNKAVENYASIKIWLDMLSETVLSSRLFVDQNGNLFVIEGE